MPEEFRDDTAPTAKEREEMPEHEFGDIANKKYPLDTDEHIRAAASYVEKEHNAGRLSDAKYHEIVARVNKAKKRRGIGQDKQDGAPWDRVYRCESGSGTIESHRRSQIGGLVARANLTRTGVFEYKSPTGEVRRELRPADEVFAKPTLDSYPHAPLTVDHPGRVTPENWRRHTVGHVADAKRSGEFVDGDVHVQDADTIDDVEKGNLVEVSSGYSCDLDPTPGEYKGQKYDAVQRNIRINHVAIGPRGWGRLGPDVRLHLDSGAADAEFLATGLTYVRDEMNELEQLKADLAKVTLDLATLRQDSTDKARADGKTIEALKAENEMLKLQEKRRSDSADDEAARARSDAKVLGLAHELMGLVADARAVFATPQDPTAKAWKADGKTADQIRREIIAHLEPEFALQRADGRDLDGEALSGPYDIAVRHWRKTEAARADAMAAATAKKKEEDDPDDDDDDRPYGGEDAAKARQAMVDKKRNDWRKNGKDSKGRGADGKAC